MARLLICNKRLLYTHAEIRNRRTNWIESSWLQVEMPLGAKEKAKSFGSWTEDKPILEEANLCSSLIVLAG